MSRNALGSPDVIGFITGAATGAIVQIVVFQAEALQVSIGAVAGGLLTAVAVYVLSRGVSGGYRLIPTRIGVSAVLGALNGLLLVTGDLDRAFTVTRLLPITAAVPIGRVTGIVGGPYLIWMLTRAKQGPEGFP
ncbi:iron chelate uptake ABC transporter family permease subunit [Salinispora arenicola]|uniref:iron chelate uptake ABC transporter family permease subunit n=1 Tax=Salinispora arenicola TaxID=168697 RepID=UPI00048D78A8|nr:iron chelate uptake ABC transporter family permease subunit [Salinispora arenicola]NIL61463.1 iron chelate uptake ABC transporter family permease subunit [Salinispora arenicola]